MKKMLLLCLVFSLHQLFAQQIKDATIDFNFVSKDVSGTIAGFSANASIDWNIPENSVLEGFVLSETLKTGNFLRDWSLKSSKYFNTEKYPKITFSSTSVKKENDTLLVQGNLSIKGITKPITLYFNKTGKLLKGTSTLFSSDFDITILKKGPEANKVLVYINIELE